MPRWGFNRLDNAPNSFTWAVKRGFFNAISQQWFQRTIPKLLYMYSTIRKTEEKSSFFNTRTQTDGKRGWLTQK